MPTYVGRAGVTCSHSEPQLDESPVKVTSRSAKDGAPKARRQKSRAKRYLTLYRVGALTIGDRRELCLIRNVSAGGMQIRAYSGIPVGTKLSVELKQGQPVSGTAQWAENDTVGVSFEEPIDVESLISHRHDRPRPRMPRIEIDCVATVRDGANVVRANVANISQGGVRLESSSELPVGGEVVVTLSGLAPHAAVVRWKDQRSYGLVFNRVLSITQLVAWLQAQQEQDISASALAT